MDISISAEILQLVFGTILRANKMRIETRVTDLLCVCHRWYNIGAGLLWRDIVLTNQQINEFAKCNGRLAHSTLSLSLRIDSTCYRLDFSRIPAVDMDIEAASEATEKLWTALRRLPQQLSRMHQLTTFSLKVQAQTSGAAAKGFVLRSEDIVSVIQGLPRTVKNLELDTHSYDRTSQDSSEHHICSAIGSRLSKLRHLRVRLARMCSELLEASTQLRPSPESGKGRTPALDIVINTIDYQNESRATICGTPYEGRKWAPGNNFKDKGEDLGRTLVRDFSNIIAGHASCNFNTLSIVEARRLRSGGGARDRRFSTIIKREILAQKTTRTPFSCIDHRKHIWHIRTRDQNGQDHDNIGNIYDLIELAEGRPWINTVEGSRFPTAYFNEDQRFKHVGKRLPVIRDKENHMKLEDSNTMLWQKEEKCGRTLLHQEEVDGLEEARCVLRDMTDAELRREHQNAN